MPTIRAITLATLFTTLFSLHASETTVKRAQAFRANGEPVVATDENRTLICEAEEFRIDTPGWTAQPWGKNYYAATFANTFISRKAFLGAPAQCSNATASITAEIKDAGTYLALVRYEAAYRFETQFRLQIEQHGKRLLDRVYGARDNVKVWAFKTGEDRSNLKKEVAWGWGAVENIVWEGHDVAVSLTPGIVTIRLIADRQTGDAAKRNIDLVMLTTKTDEIARQLEKAGRLPFDGMLTQQGDVWLKAHNPGANPLTVKSLSFPGGPWQQHSPYWLHIRPDTWKPIELTVEPGKTSEWIDVGGTMDTLNDGQWGFHGSGPYVLTIGLRNAAGTIETIETFTGEGELQLAGQADTRYVRRAPRREQALIELMEYLRNLPTRGKTPSETLIYAITVQPEKGNSSEAAAVDEFRQMFGMVKAEPNYVDQDGYIDVRGKTPEQLAEYCESLGDKAKTIDVVSLGDEIALPAPTGDAAVAGFHDWLRAQGLTPNDVVPNVGADWQAVKYDPSAKLMHTEPARYYWSRRYLYRYGIKAIKELTDVVKKYMPNAHIGANFSSHHGGAVHAYLGEVHKWVNCFREDGMTLPWSEDYAWQLPFGSPQMNGINLDLSRAGIRDKPGQTILYYVMPHWPGNTPRMWRRMFHNAVGHGMGIINLFEFRSVCDAYTENHVTNPEMYGTVLTTFREYGLYEDIIQTGRNRPAETALWFSEVADIWEDNHGSFAAAKRALYVAIQHQQVPVDIVVEADAFNGALNQYKTLYITDRHVSHNASVAIAKWVENGGTVFATAGAGMYDERNRPNAVMQTLLGVTQTEISEPDDSTIGYIKEDLPFATACGQVVGNTPPLPVYGVRTAITPQTATVLHSFADGAPAVTERTVGQGTVHYCAFLPSLSFFAPAIPRQPLDRGSSDDAMAHLMPTDFDQTARTIIGRAVRGLQRPVLTPYPALETTMIESPKGTAIVLTNWSTTSLSDVPVTVSVDIPTKQVTMASGIPVTVTKNANGVIVFTIESIDIGDVLILR